MVVSDLGEMIAGMEPRLDPRAVVYAALEPGADWPVEPGDPGLIGAFREAEGWTLILTQEVAERAGVKAAFEAAWITLTVHSDLAAVGLTAAFATALSDAGISLNVVAAVQHDHIFVPVDDATKAMTALKALQARGAG